MLTLIKALLKPHMQLCYIIIRSNFSIKILHLHLDVVLDVVIYYYYEIKIKNHMELKS